MQKKSAVELEEIATSELQLNLVLPGGTVDNINGSMFMTFDEEDFAVILKIYRTYEVLAKINRSLSELVEYTEGQRDVAIVTSYKCADALEIVNNDRLMVYKIRNAERNNVAIRERKSKIKTVLIAAGSGLAGVGVGIIIGLFAVRR